jgi:hypothetical protein
MQSEYSSLNNKAIEIEFIWKYATAKCIHYEPWITTKTFRSILWGGPFFGRQQFTDKRISGFGSNCRSRLHFRRIVDTNSFLIRCNTFNQLESHGRKASEFLSLLWKSEQLLATSTKKWYSGLNLHISVLASSRTIDWKLVLRRHSLNFTNRACEFSIGVIVHEWPCKMLPFVLHVDDC